MSSPQINAPAPISVMPGNEPRAGINRFALPILLQIWTTALRWKWVALGIIMAALVLGGIATLMMTPKYTGTARIEISREQQNITKVDGLDAPGSGQDNEFYKTQYALLAARSLAERVARSLNLAGDATFFAAHGIDLGGEDRTAATRAAREKQAVTLLLANIRIDPIPVSRLVDIGYVSGSPEISAKIANEWAQQFVAAGIDRRFASTDYARRILSKGLTDLATKLEASERAAVRFASQNNIVALDQVRGADGKTEVARTLASSNLEALNNSLAQATADRIAAESRALAAGTPVANGGGQAAIEALRQRRGEVVGERAKLLAQFESGYPAVQALTQQIAALDASIVREEARGRDIRSADYTAAASREAQLNARVRELTQRFDRQQQSSIQYNILQREADTNRQLYDSLLQRSKEIGVSEVGATNVAIVDPAQVPNSPSSPRLLLNLVAALFLGIAVAAIAVFGLDQIDEGLRDPADVTRLLDVSLLGSIPRQLEDVHAPTQLADAKSDLSEAYLSVQSSLSFTSDHGVPRSFMVTSSRAGEGKSTSSLSLAVMLGKTGRRVVLVDTDMRSPSVHRLFGATNEQGVSNLLAGQDDWQSLVRNSTFANVAYLSAGPPPPSAAELLSSRRLADLVAQLLTQFDHVVVDSPPILGLADAPLISRSVEGCVFVIEAEGVAVRGLRAALDRLLTAHAHIFGVVLTKVRNTGNSYGYSYGFNYGRDQDD